MRTFPDLVTVLAEVVVLGLEDGQVQLGHALRRDVRVSFSQVVHQHASSLQIRYHMISDRSS